MSAESQNPPACRASSLPRSSACRATRSSCSSAKTSRCRARRSPPRCSRGSASRFGSSSRTRWIFARPPAVRVGGHALVQADARARASASARPERPRRPRLAHGAPAHAARGRVAWPAADGAGARQDRPPRPAHQRPLLERPLPEEARPLRRGRRPRRRDEGVPGVSRGRRDRVHHVPLGYHESFGRLLQLERDIPVIFLGDFRLPRRRRILRRLEREGVDVLTLGDYANPDLWGEGRVELMNRAKIALNIPRLEGHLPDVRLVVAMANGALVVSEPLYLPEPYVPGVHYVEAPAERLAESIREYLADEAARRRITEEAHRFVTTELTLERSFAPAARAGGGRARPAGDAMKNVPSDYYERMHAVEKGHWWRTGMLEITRALLRDRVDRGHLSLLDAGCGTGAFLAWASRTGAFDRLCGFDLSPEAVELARAAVPGVELHVAPVDAIPVRRRLIRPRRAERRAATRGRTGGRCLARRAATRAERGGSAGRSHERRTESTARAGRLAALRRGPVARAARGGRLPRRAAHVREQRPLAWGSIRGKRPRPPTGTTCGIPASSGALVNAIGSSLLGLEARYLRSPGRRLGFGHTLFAVATPGGAGTQDVQAFFDATSSDYDRGYASGGSKGRVLRRRAEVAVALLGEQAGGRARRRHGRRRAAGRARSPGLARYGDRHRPCDGGACARAAAAR